MGIWGRPEKRKQQRCSAGGHLCHQLQGVMVGEVKIKACGQRLAPQPRLYPLLFPSEVLVACVCVCVSVCVEDGFVGEGQVRDVSGA